MFDERSFRKGSSVIGINSRGQLKRNEQNRHNLQSSRPIAVASAGKVGQRIEIFVVGANSLHI